MVKAEQVLCCNSNFKNRHEVCHDPRDSTVPRDHGNRLNHGTTCCGFDKVVCLPAWPGPGDHQPHAGNVRDISSSAVQQISALIVLI